MGNGSGTRSTLARMAASRYSKASTKADGFSKAAQAYARKASPEAIERAAWKDAVPVLRARAQRMAAQPIGDLHPPRTTITLASTEKQAEAGAHPVYHGWRGQNAARERTVALMQAEAAKVAAGPDRATALRYARLNSPEGKAVRTQVRDTLMQLEVARAQTRAEKPGTAAYAKAKAREQALGAKLKAANERQRGIESGKIKVTGVAKVAAAPKSAKAASAKAPKSSEPKLGKAISFDESFSNEHLVSDQYNALLGGMTVKTGSGNQAGTYRVTTINGDRLTVMERIRRYSSSTGKYEWSTRTGEATRQELFDALNARLSPGAQAIQTPTDLYPDQQQSA